MKEGKEIKQIKPVIAKMRPARDKEKQQVR